MRKPITLFFACIFLTSLGFGQIRILSVNPGSDEISLKNFGDSMVDISSYRLCTEFVYSTGISIDVDVDVVSGSTELMAGDTVQLSWLLTDNAADLGLYLPEGLFADTATMVDFVQWGSAGNGRESVADSKGIWTAGDFITGEGPYFYSGDGVQNGLPFWMEIAEEDPNIRFVWVDPANDAIYLKNFGNQTVDVSEYRLCSEFNYTSNLTSGVSLLSGSTQLAPGDTLAVSWTVTGSEADLGLYLPDGAFSDTAAMVDFLQWGAAGVGREPVANSKGIWTAGEFISEPGPFSYVGDGSQNGLAFWAGTPLIESNLRFVWVNPASDAIYIKNFGGDTVDVSNYRLCSEFAYTGDLTGDISPLFGSTNLAPGDTLGVTWPVTDSAADLGLYLPEGTFNDTAAMVDFLQWGADGLGRESIADAKGIWTAGDFIEGMAPYVYIGDGSENGVETWMADSISTNLDPALLRQISINVYPSLVDQHTQVSIELPVRGEVTLSLLDLNGRIMRQETHLVVPGFHRYEMDLGTFARGLYYIQFSLGNELIGTSRVIKQ